MRPSPSEAYLEEWHDRHSGACRTSFMAARSTDGRTGYERLAALAADARTVLDVGCGDGTLLEHVRAAAPEARLLGVDLSDGELALAAERVPDALLQRARAQQLPFEDASVDAVLCHMALMLMDEPERVLSEARRVLRAGGRFAAVTQRDVPPSGSMAQIFTALRPLWGSVADKQRLPPQLGDRRTYDSDSLRSLAEPFFDRVELSEIEVVSQVPRTELWSFLTASFYGFDALPPAAAEEALEGVDLPKVVHLRMPLVEVLCTVA